MDSSERGNGAEGTRDEAEDYFGPRFLARLHTRLHANPLTSVVTKIVVTIAGVVVMLAGLVMMVTPGPGIVGLILGLAILSTEWRWADRWLDAARAYAKKAADAALDMDSALRRRRLLGVGAALGAGLAVLAIGIAEWGWPESAEDGWSWIQSVVGGVPDLPGMDA